MLKYTGEFMVNLMSARCPGPVVAKQIEVLGRRLFSLEVVSGLHLLSKAKSYNCNETLTSFVSSHFPNALEAIKIWNHS